MANRDTYKIEDSIPSNIKKLSEFYGYPDVFHFNQFNAKEEVINSETINHGYSEQPQIKDEYLSFRGVITNAASLKEELRDSIGLLLRLKKNEKEISPQTTQQVQTRVRKPLPGLKVLVTNKMNDWIKSLSMTDSDLEKLADNPPHGFKEVTLLKNLYIHKVPLVRAVWFIKIVLFNEQNNNKQKLDPRGRKKRWTEWITTYINEIFKEKLSNKSIRKDLAGSIEYTVKLLYWTYVEGLVDHHKLFNFIIERLKIENLSVFIASLTFQYLNDICFCPDYAEKLLNVCCMKMNEILGPFNMDIIELLNSSPSNAKKVKIYSLLCNIVKVIISYCPDMIAHLNDHEFLKHVSVPILPVRQAIDENVILNNVEYSIPINNGNRYLLSLESLNQINIRSLRKKIQLKKEHQHPQPIKIWELDVINILDSWMKEYDLDKLYTYLEEQLAYNVNNHRSFTFLICEWAITVCRYGIYRIYIAAALLYRYKMKYYKNNSSDIDKTLQDWLISFLDLFANEEYKSDNTERDYLKSFINVNINLNSLILDISRLYSEFIRLELFSFKNYVYNLIARGIFSKNQPSKKREIHQMFLNQIYLDSKQIKYKQIASNLGFIEDKSNSRRDKELEIFNTFSEKIKTNSTEYYIYLTNIIPYYIDSVYEFFSLSNLFVNHLKSSMENGSLVGVEQMRFIKGTLFLLEVCKDYRTLIDLIMWLLERSTFTDYCEVICHTLNNNILASICSDKLVQLIELLAKKYQNLRSKSIGFIVQKYYNYYSSNSLVSKLKESNVDEPVNVTKPKLKLNINPKVQSSSNISVKDEIMNAIQGNINDGYINQVVKSLKPLNASKETYLSNTILNFYNESLKFSKENIDQMNVYISNFVYIICEIRTLLKDLGSWDRIFYKVLKDLIYNAIEKDQPHPDIQPSFIILVLSQMINIGLTSFNDLIIYVLKDILTTLTPSNQNQWKESILNGFIDIICFILFNNDLKYSIHDIHQIIKHKSDTIYHNIPKETIKLIIQFIYNVKTSELSLQNNTLDNIKILNTYLFEICRGIPDVFYEVFNSFENKQIAYELFYPNDNNEMEIENDNHQDYQSRFSSIIKKNTNEWMIHESWLKIKLLIQYYKNLEINEKENIEMKINESLAMIIVQEIIKKSNYHILLSLINLLDNPLKNKIASLILQYIKNELTNHETTSNNNNNNVTNQSPIPNINFPNIKDSYQIILNIIRVCMPSLSLSERRDIILLLSNKRLKMLDFNNIKWETFRLYIYTLLTITGWFIYEDQKQEKNELFDHLIESEWIDIITNEFHLLEKPIVQITLLDEIDLFEHINDHLMLISKYPGKKKDWALVIEKTYIGLFTSLNIPPHYRYRMEQTTMRPYLAHMDDSMKMISCNSIRNAFLYDFSSLNVLEKHGESPLLEKCDYKVVEKSFRYAKRRPESMLVTNDRKRQKTS